MSHSGLGCGPGGSGTKGWPLCGGQVIPLVGEREPGDRVLAPAARHRRRRADRPALLARLQATFGSGHGWAFRGSLIAGVLVLVQAGSAASPSSTASPRSSWRPISAPRCCCSACCSGSGAKARSEAAAEAGASAKPPVRGLKPYAADGRGPALLRDRRRRLHGRHRGGGGERRRAEHRGRASRLRSPVPDLRRRQVPAVREQPADRHPPHPPGLRLCWRRSRSSSCSASPSRAARATGCSLLGALLLFCQFLLGAMNVWLGEHGPLIVAHLATATLLWATVSRSPTGSPGCPAARSTRERAPRAEASAAAA